MLNIKKLQEAIRFQINSDSLGNNSMPELLKLKDLEKKYLDKLNNYDYKMKTFFYKTDSEQDSLKSFYYNKRGIKILRSLEADGKYFRKFLTDGLAIYNVFKKIKRDELSK